MTTTNPDLGLNDLNLTLVATGTKHGDVPVVVKRVTRTYALVSVPSRAGRAAPGDAYDVFVAQGVARCTCKGYLYRGTCWHVDAVRRAAL